MKLEEYLSLKEQYDKNTDIVHGSICNTALPLAKNVHLNLYIILSR